MGDPGFLQLVQDVRDNPDWQAKRTDVAMRAFLQQLQFLRKSEEVLDAASSDAQRQRMLNSDRAFQSMVANTTRSTHRRSRDSKRSNQHQGQAGSHA